MSIITAVGAVCCLLIRELSIWIKKDDTQNLNAHSTRLALIEQTLKNIEKRITALEHPQHNFDVKQALHDLLAKPPKPDK